MLKLSLVLTVFFAATALGFTANYTGIWPQELLFNAPNKATGWAHAGNEADNLIADSIFYADPVVIPQNDISTSFSQLENWGWAVFDEGLTPSFSISQEQVISYINDGSWNQFADTTTNDNGQITANITNVPLVEGVYPLLHLLTPNNHYGRSALWRFLDGTQTIVFEIDGTLTSNEFASVCSGLNTCSPSLRANATATVLFWYNQGYQIVYLSARPATFYEKTIQYLIEKGFPPGLLRLADSVSISESPETYKAEYLTTLQDAGLNIEYAYGSDDNDINAYLAAGLVGRQIFVPGSSGGDDGTVALGNDFSSHLANITNNINFPVAVIQGVRLTGSIGTVTNGSNDVSSATVFAPFFLLIVAVVAFLL
jgi:phosphatidate phosphatase PAH1